MVSSLLLFPSLPIPYLEAQRVLGVGKGDKEPAQVHRGSPRARVAGDPAGHRRVGGGALPGV